MTIMLKQNAEKKDSPSRTRNARNTTRNRSSIARESSILAIPRKPALLPLADHPNAFHIASSTSKKMKGWNINVALLGERKYMVNDCLGIKVSAGEFAVRFGTAKAEAGSYGARLTFSIDRIDLNAVSVRVRPNLSNPANPCHFSKRIQVGGSAKDVSLQLVYNPRIDLDECTVIRPFDVTIKVRIGRLNLKPLPSKLDAVAKNMIEDALTKALELLTPDKIAAITATIPEGLCIDKLFFYRRYMEMISAQTTMYPLPVDYIDQLSRHFPNADLTKVQFGCTPQGFLLRGLGITDANRIYYKDRWFVERLRKGDFDLTRSDDDLKKVLTEALYHELRHVEQCAELGGRDAYATRWFRDFEYAFLLQLLLHPAGMDAELSRRMPMEEDAGARAQKVYDCLTHGGASCP